MDQTDIWIEKKQLLINKIYQAPHSSEDSWISTKDTLVKFHLQSILSLLWEQEIGSSNLSTPTLEEPISSS